MTQNALRSPADPGGPFEIEEASLRVSVETPGRAEAGGEPPPGEARSGWTLWVRFRFSGSSGVSSTATQPPRDPSPTARTAGPGKQ
jgi:hypothetical protein